MNVSVPSETPALVGAAAVEQRAGADGVEAVELMVSAAEAAAGDAGAAGLLAQVDEILVPRGFWTYADPGRIVAERFGARARTVVAQIGVLQTALFGRAASAIARGDARAVLVIGGEARHRARAADRAGVAAPDTVQEGVTPDETLRPADDILDRVEIARNLATPAHQYAVMETAWRARRGLSVGEHARDLAGLWSRFAAVATENPHAWDRGPHSVEELVGRPDRYLAHPYTKRHVSQWNVDQAAALLFCSVDAARAAGADLEGAVFPVAVADSNFMLPMVRRAAIDRAPGFEAAARRLYDLAACGPDDVAVAELYSCFPIAVRLQLETFGFGSDRVPTVTGGMAFAGGPLNNFVLQAMVRVVEALRERPARAVVTAVSGMLTKQGASLWSTAPPERPFAHVDVGADAEAASTALPVDPGATGPGRVAGYTVVHDREGRAVQAVAVCDVGGARTVATSSDPALMAAMETEEWCAREITVGEEGALRP
jgi:acetyl-CoA C-acetyltransferase